jgi:hypothetical protein
VGSKTGLLFIIGLLLDELLESDESNNESFEGNLSVFWLFPPGSLLSNISELLNDNSRSYKLI